MSDAISPITRSWAGVRANGRDARRAPGESPVCLESDPFPLVRHGPLPPGEADLEKDQLFDDKAPMGRRVAPGERIEARPFRRKVEFADG